MTATVAPSAAAPPVPVGAPPPAPAPPAPQWAPPAPQWGTPQAPPPPGGWQPLPPPPKKVWPRVIAWTVGVFAVLIGAVVVLALIFGDKSAAKLHQYMKGKGVTYQSADGRVTVRFPEQPKLQDFAIPLGNGNSENEHAALLSRHTYEFGFTEIQLPAGVDAAHRVAGLKGSIVGGAKGAEAVLTKSGPTTFRGYQAYEGRALAKDGSELAILSFLARDALYTMFVHVEKDAAATLHEYEQSLQIAR